MSQIKVYVSHSIRGKKGKAATKEDMEVNNQLAIKFGERLREIFPGVDFYIPAENDEFVIEAYYAKYITEEQILTIDCAIIDKRNFVLAYSPDGYLSSGMKVEIEYAGLHSIPCIVIPDLEPGSTKIINRQIAECM